MLTGFLCMCKSDNSILTRKNDSLIILLRFKRFDKVWL